METETESDQNCSELPQLLPCMHKISVTIDTKGQCHYKNFKMGDIDGAPILGI